MRESISPNPAPRRRAGVDAQDAILPVMRSAQKNLQFERIEFLKKSFEVGLEFLKNFRLRFGSSPSPSSTMTRKSSSCFPSGAAAQFCCGANWPRQSALRLFVLFQKLSRHQGVEFAQTFCVRIRQETSADA